MKLRVVYINTGRLKALHGEWIKREALAIILRKRDQHVCIDIWSDRSVMRCHPSLLAQINLLFSITGTVTRRLYKIEGVVSNRQSRRRAPPPQLRLRALEEPPGVLWVVRRGNKWPFARCDGTGRISAIPIVPFTGNGAVIVDCGTHLITFQPKARFAGPGARTSDKLGDNEESEECNEGERARKCGLDVVGGCTGEETVGRGLGAANFFPLFVARDGGVLWIKNRYVDLKGKGNKTRTSAR